MRLYGDTDMTLCQLLVSLYFYRFRLPLPSILKILSRTASTGLKEYFPCLTQGYVLFHSLSIEYADHLQHPEIAEICQRIMAVVVQRLEQSYMRIAERDPSEPALRKIPALAKKARDLGNLN